MAASVSAATIAAVNRSPVQLNFNASAFLGNYSWKKLSSKIINHPKTSSTGNFKVSAEYDESKQTSKDRWGGLAFDTSDDQQDITRGKGMVDTLFQAPVGSGTHYAVMSSYDYISTGLRQLDNMMDGFYIAPDFMDKLVVHITKNFLNLPNIKVPLILGIWGGKGQGKSFQCELVFSKMGIKPHAGSPSLSRQSEENTFQAPCRLPVPVLNSQRKHTPGPMPKPNRRPGRTKRTIRDMLNLNKLDFTALEVYGRNYLKWVQDVKLHLTAKGIRATIEEPIDNKPVDEVEKTTAMILIRRHIHDALQTKYFVEEDPRIFWLAITDRFDHQKDIYFPETRHCWQHLRF
ncbi:ribulose bisphosphate carboxylase/oxygenase activase, chloroplastic-like isoform X3 [Malus domestica]|uniref:ribulose bisphosphate carboxylase/oxygenase activase, chloroplastic-like isoform X3 n=1 Tax=Malus domestica TaxID=3750 RepID=UPI0039754847